MAKIMELSPCTKEFIRTHADDDIRLLALSAKKEEDLDLPFALNQISGRQMARHKLPSWAVVEDIIYPPHISMEQCSSEQTARYKACVAERFVDKKHSCLVDITGGFGVDFSYLAQDFQRCIYIERQEQLCEIARHNLPLLGLSHAEVVCGDGVEWIKGQSEVLNTSHTTNPTSLTSVTTPSPLWEGKGRGAVEGKGRGTFLFIDPARRDSHGNRTYAIGDCTPDIIGFIDEMAEKAETVMIKLSPMLDWHATVSDINRAVEGHDAVREVHIVSTGNECKELLIVVSKRSMKPLKIYCVNGKSTAPLPLPSPGGEGVDSNEGDGEVSSEELSQDILSSFDVFAFTPSSSPSNVTIPFPSGEGTGRGAVEGMGRGVGCILLVPNASVMKAGCFNQVGWEYDVCQISSNSHLFVSDHEVEGFPGKSYQIIAISSMNKKELRSALQGITQANITTRNFPLSPDQLRKRLKLREGGDIYIFATTTKEKEHVLYVTRKMCAKR